MCRRGRSRIIVRVETGTAAADEYSVLCDEIRTLLEGPAPARQPSLAQLENTLTEGYARALELEAERLRLERRIGELGRDVRSGSEPAGEEIATLAARLSHTSTRLARLRALLRPLRRHADAVRARDVAVG